MEDEVKNESEEIKKENTENVTEEVKEEVAEIVENINSEFDELNDRYKRLFAEFENFKKRSQKERESLYGIITGDVVSSILPVMDNLEKAAETKTEDKNYQDGVKMVVKQLSDVLDKFGMTEIETVGQKFDPELHEAVSHIDDPSKGEQEIVGEYRKGYKIGNKVIRHSMVIVAN